MKIIRNIFITLNIFFMLVSATEMLKNKYDGFAEPQEWRTQTKFERKGLQADRVITELYFEKIDPDEA